MAWFRGKAAKQQAISEPARRRFSAQMIGISDVLSVLANSDQKISRTEALSVPAVTRGRNLICSISTLPLQLVRLADSVVIDNPLLRQIDPDTPNVTTLAQTVEDLLLEGISWWRITSTDFDGFPASARRLDPATVSVNPPNSTRNPAPLPSGVDPREAVVYVDGRPVSGREIIRFDSPNPPILVVGARVIRRAILLDKAAKMYADDPRPLDYFKETPDATPLDDEEIDSFLSKWIAIRKKRGTGYINKAADYHTVDSPSPQQLQLVELQGQANLDIAASLFGIDPEEVGQNVTSRTYFNAQDRRLTRINEVLAPYMSAITQRLSMGDVTRRGYEVRFDLGDYLKADPATRAQVQEAYLAMGVVTADEIRAQEGWPGPAPTPPAPEPAPEPQPAEESTVEQSQQPTHTFSTKGLTFVDLPLETFSVDQESRTITGVAVPYGTKQGNGYRFERGALQFKDISRIKLNINHDRGRTVGVATDIKDSNNGLTVKFRVPQTAAGDEALVLASEGVLDGLSVEVFMDERTDTVPDPRNKTGSLVKRADLTGVALVGDPAFTDARVTRVQMSNEEESVEDTDTKPAATPEPAQVPALTIDQITALFSALNIGSNTTTTMVPFEAEKVQAPTKFADPVRAFVNPLRPVAVSTVTEPVSYRFDRNRNLQPAAHDFGFDIIAASKAGRPDTAEHARVMEFMNAQFNVAVGDVNELNPTINVPRYIDERSFQYPIWSAVQKGAPPNGVQPFQWPAFSSAANLVADHTPGSEPNTGSYVTTLGTVTPTAMSGKARINREVWDQGGVPGIGNLIWQRITRDWYEALEADVTATLDAASPTSLGTFTVGGGTDHRTLVREMRANMSRLQFVRGGFRFDVAFAQNNLYVDLVDASDSTGRPIFPMINPMNSDGSADSRWSRLDVGGVAFLPAWSLGASGAVAESSYLIDRTAVDAWATPPLRLDFTQIAVAYIDLCVWGYKASVVNDINGVREIIYDPS